MKKGKTKVGVVVSDAMDKSVTVMVERMFMEPVFKKHIRRKKKFMAHDEKNECSKGDVVMIRECKPLSKMKRWCVETILEKGVQ